MGTRDVNRLWIGAGAAVIIVLAAMSWFFVISPKYAEARELDKQTGEARQQIVELQKKIIELEKQESQLPQFEQALDRAQDALPSDSGVPDFLRQLQASGTQVGVEVSGLTVGNPAQVQGVSNVWSLPLQLTASGTAVQLGRFLDQLQGAGQRRAVLIQAINLSSEGGPAAERRMSLSLNAKAFVAPEAGAGAPTVVTD